MDNRGKSRSPTTLQNFQLGISNPLKMGFSMHKPSVYDFQTFNKYHTIHIFHIL